MHASFCIIVETLLSQLAQSPYQPPAELCHETWDGKVTEGVESSTCRGKEEHPFIYDAPASHSLRWSTVQTVVEFKSRGSEYHHLPSIVERSEASRFSSASSHLSDDWVSNEDKNSSSCSTECSICDRNAQTSSDDALAVASELNEFGKRSRPSAGLDSDESGRVSKRRKLPENGLQVRSHALECFAATS
ncbi:hypothetical protein EST38_g13082, partial [Candolleomyces aberdarensis]